MNQDYGFLIRNAKGNTILNAKWPILGYDIAKEGTFRTIKLNIGSQLTREQAQAAAPTPPWVVNNWSHGAMVTVKREIYRFKHGYSKPPLLYMWCAATNLQLRCNGYGVKSGAYDSATNFAMTRSGGYLTQTIPRQLSSWHITTTTIGLPPPPTFSASGITFPFQADELRFNSWDKLDWDVDDEYVYIYEYVRCQKSRLRLDFGQYMDYELLNWDDQMGSQIEATFHITPYTDDTFKNRSIL